MGRDDIHIHIHLHLPDFISQQFQQITESLQRIETRMSALTDAVVAMKARIDEDVAHLRSLLDEALAANAGDDAEIARITAEADEAVAAITAIDPVADFPAAPPA